MVYKRSKLVYGVGTNDANYSVCPRHNGKQTVCAYYAAWQSVLERCYSLKFIEKHPTYAGCSVCEEWLTFSKFKSWMQTQPWEGNQLDKDLLVKGNKIYSPDTCVFIPQRLNKFLTEIKTSKGLYPTGVSYQNKKKNMINEYAKPYRAEIGNGKGSKRFLGFFSTPEEAYQAWLKAKLELAKELAGVVLAEGGDPRIAKALVERYENYSENNC